MFGVISIICFVVSVHCFQYKAVDLTHNHGKDSIYTPVHSGFEMIIEQRGLFGDTDIWVAYNTIKTTEHLGTHMDAPQHFNEFSWTMHQIPIENLIGPGVIVDVKAKAAQNPDYEVTQSDLKDWETKYGRIPDGAVVIMNSGWHERFPDKNRVFNTNNMNDSSSYHFPGWHIDAVTWLVTQRSIHILGVDTPSMDYGQSSTFPVHILVSKENICGIENVGYLDKIPASGTIISAAAMKIVDGSGSPTRVFALIPKDDTNSTSMKKFSLKLIILIVSVFLFLC